MFKIEVKREFRRDNGKIRSIIKIIQSDNRVSTSIIKCENHYSDIAFLEEESWSELKLKEFNLLTEIGKRIDQIRENMKWYQEKSDKKIIKVY